MKQDPERYFRILEQVAMARTGDDIESCLADAFELGRSMVDQMVPPDEVTHIHHEAVVRLAQDHTELSLAQVADHLTRPLMEMSMAYGLAFREQMERRYESMINARLEQSRKLEAVGTLAAGIAHDFNNILGSIVGFAEMTGDDLADGSAGKQNIQQIVTASFRARDLVARMLAFARQSPVKPVPVEVVAEVREALALLRASLSPGVKLCFESSLAQATVVADPIQIQQIVMNLCINAADAMSECGTIVIRIDSVRTDSAPKSVTAPVTESEAIAQICLAVADTGSGMAPEVLERVFDPFFTTKAPNKGSGLGLSVVYGIVTQLQGVIEVESRASGTGTGTEFRVLLPLLAGEQAGKQQRYEEEHGSHISH
jgi:signal transduction histidine kinase